MTKKMRIGDLLIKDKLISKEQLDKAIEKQQESGSKLGKILIDSGFVKENKLLSLLSSQLDIPYIDLKHFELNPELVHILPEVYARRFRAIPLQQNDEALLVGMADPQDIYAYDELTQLLKQPLQLALVSEAELLQSIDMIYRRGEEISGFAEQLSDELQNTSDAIDLGSNLGAQDAPVVKLLQSLFQDAVQVNASDIHIEPDTKALRIRQRVDGLLQERIIDDKRIAPALTQRLKLMAGLDIAEKRVPQDGRFNIKIKDKQFDVRLSTLPMHNGESVVMRLLDQNMSVQPLSELGMPEELIQRIQKLTHRPHGMLLVTGPTGSGKTTSLYSMLNDLNQTEKKIITVEDPVEYRLSRINQVQVNPKIDLDFARILRSTLRQDPDIIMVGEIRDQETAHIALRAAITGHLVLATLHTNDAMSSAWRLIDMGCEPFMVAAALKAILSQRLVRRLCQSCVDTYQPEAQEIDYIQSFIGSAAEKAHFKIGRGCVHCNQTGYSGRSGVYELLELDAPVLAALRANQHTEFIKAIKQQTKFRPLGLRALDLALAGETSIAEVLRTTAELEDDDIQLMLKDA